MGSDYAKLVIKCFTQFWREVIRDIKQLARASQHAVKNLH